MTGAPRRGVAALVAVVAAGLLAGAAVPAAAHPFGPPPVGRLDADGRRLVLRWEAAPDDYLALAGALGVLPDRQVFFFEGTEPVAGPSGVAPDEEQRLAAAPAFAAYLRDGTAVRQDGRPCPAEVAETAQLAERGVELVFTCPAPVREVDVEVRLLTDLHPAYRTVALAQGADPARRLYTLDRPVHSWRFGAGGVGRATPLAAAALAVTLLGMAGAWSWRRRAGARGGRVTPGA